MGGVTYQRVAFDQTSQVGWGESRILNMARRTYRLIGPDSVPYESSTKGTLGGHRKSRIYGRLDCPGALRALARGGPYAKYRVFFADEATAIKAGYRPCWLCMRGEYIEWKRGIQL
jgi:hypothetical protein